jgi:membrane associated rhomboid family serine protease
VVLIALNASCFVMQRLVEFSQPDLVGKWLGLNDWGVNHGFVWQFLTYTFLHGGIVHLLANMMLLFFTGRELEPLLGRRHFLGIYFGGGLVGGLAQWALGPALPPDGPLMGASACVLATLIGFTTILPELEISGLLFFVIPMRLRAKFISYAAVGSSVFFIILPHLATLSWFAGISNVIDRITLGFSHYAHYAHLGGCVLGWFYVKQLGYGNPWWIQRGRAPQAHEFHAIHPRGDRPDPRKNLARRHSQPIPRRTAAAGDGAGEDWQGEAVAASWPFREYCLSRLR